MQLIDINVTIVKGFINSSEGMGRMERRVRHLTPFVGLVVTVSAINHLIDINELKFALFQW